MTRSPACGFRGSKVGLSLVDGPSQEGFTSTLWQTHDTGIDPGARPGCWRSLKMPSRRDYHALAFALGCIGLWVIGRLAFELFASGVEEQVPVAQGVG